MRPAALFPSCSSSSRWRGCWSCANRSIDLYPWATRRRSTSRLSSRSRRASAHPPVERPRGRLRRPRRVSCLPPCWQAVQTARRAWTYTQYNGLGAAIAAVAGRIGPGDAVLADHPAWGTLALVHGRNVLGGQADGSGRDNGQSIAAILPDLVRRRPGAEGRRVLCPDLHRARDRRLPFAGAASAPWSGRRLRTVSRSWCSTRRRGSSCCRRTA